jgi:uncharacterized membrane protein
VEDNQQSLKSIATVAYALQAAGTWLESHFRWQIATFWWGLLWSVIGAILAFVLVGFIVLFADAVWIIYRIVKGWLRLAERREVA